MPRPERFTPRETDHFLERPEFGPVPERFNSRPKKPKRWDALLEVIREHPSTPEAPQAAAIARYSGKTQKRRADTDKHRVRMHLDKNFPMEHWKIFIRTVGWHQRTIYAVFFGVDPVGAAQERKTRRAIYENIVIQGQRNKEMKAIADRLAAEEHNRSNRAGGALG